ncbi:acyltransferase [Microbacterium lacus]|uniref:acyltransferase n=1 Tax=Microbacterium lacus TaxID=415217 RepID=UPI003850BD45
MISPFDHSPWDFWDRADPADHTAQRALQTDLMRAHPGWRFDDRCFVSDHSSVDNDDLTLGARTYVAAGAYLTGSLHAGSDCSINPYTVLRGRIVLGDGVRIGAHTSILGFNHTMSDPDLPVFRQPLTSRGIRVGDDVWIGSHVVILDGVTVGSHSVIAAGAVVTKDVPNGAIVAGNPARFLKWRIAPADPLPERIEEFGKRARASALAILERSWDASADLFTDRPGQATTVRAQCDAIEIADLLLGTAPPQLPAAEQVRRLRSWQDAETGAVAPLGKPHPDLNNPDVAYHVECVGYALDLLGSQFAHPVPALSGGTAAEVTAFLDGLPWESEAWTAGHWVDAVGTSLYWSRQRGDARDPAFAETLLGWLVSRADADTGVWGGGDLLQRVNGFYRASRGTFAQFGIPIPYPRAVVDTVLVHAEDETLFASAAQNACNVLDVAHPLWLARDAGHRAAEVTALARTLLGQAMDHWVDGEGFAFHPGSDGAAPGLQGTEMWLAIVWYLADLAGLSDRLGYRPRGIHQPEPAASLA